MEVTELQHGPPDSTVAIGEARHKTHEAEAEEAAWQVAEDEKAIEAVQKAVDKMEDGEEREAALAALERSHALLDAKRDWANEKAQSNPPSRRLPNPHCRLQAHLALVSEELLSAERKLSVMARSKEAPAHSHGGWAGMEGLGREDGVVGGAGGWGGEGWVESVAPTNVAAKTAASVACAELAVRLYEAPGKPHSRPKA